MYGIKIGASKHALWANGNANISPYGLDGEWGLTASLFLESALTSYVALRAEPGYTRKRFFEGYGSPFTTGLVGPRPESWSQIDYLQLFFLAKLTSDRTGRFYGLIGPRAAILLGRKSEPLQLPEGLTREVLAEALPTFDYGGALGLGFQVTPHSQRSPFVEIRYEFDANAALTDGERVQVGEVEIREVTRRSFTIQVGMSF